MGKQISEHPNPAWASRADCTLDIIVSNMAPDIIIERLAARRKAENIYEVCCIPWWTYGFGLGDTIRVDPAPKIDAWIFSEVVETSERENYRVLLSDPSPQAMQTAASTFASMGCLVEVFNASMLSVDAANSAANEWLLGVLDDDNPVLDWSYESARDMS